MDKEFIFGNLLCCFGHRMTAPLDCKGTLWVLEFISLTPKCLVYKRQRISVFILSFLLGYLMKTLYPCFLRKGLLRVSLSKVDKCQVYQIVEKQVSMWLRVWTLKSDHFRFKSWTCSFKAIWLWTICWIFFRLLWNGDKNSIYCIRLLTELKESRYTGTENCAWDMVSPW